MLPNWANGPGGRHFALFPHAMTLCHGVATSRRKAVWGPKRTIAAISLIAIGLATSAFAEGRHHRSARKAQAGRPNSIVRNYKIDDELSRRAGHTLSSQKSKVIVELVPGAPLPAPLAAYAKRNGKLGIINGHVLELPDRLIRQLSQHPSVFRMHFDRPATKFNYRTSLTIGTRAIRQTLGLTGAGVGVAVIDSGVAAWHDDLTNTSSALFPYGNQRVAAFVDFINGQTQPYDDNGHGTHVAGIIAGNGYDSNGEKAGTAPGASIVSLKVLDAN